MEMDYTRKFSIRYEKDPEIKAILTSVYRSLQEKGYNPINQIVGYILSEDPTYITNYNNARTLIRKLDRDELLQELVKQYLIDCPRRLSIGRPLSGGRPFLSGYGQAASLAAAPFRTGHTLYNPSFVFSRGCCISIRNWFFSLAKW